MWPSDDVAISRRWGGATALPERRHLTGTLTACPFILYYKMPYARRRMCTSSGRDDSRRSLPGIKNGDTGGFGGCMYAFANGKGATLQLNKEREHIPNRWNTRGLSFGNAVSDTMAEAFDNGSKWACNHKWSLTEREYPNKFPRNYSCEMLCLPQSVTYACCLCT